MSRWIDIIKAHRARYRLSPWHDIPSATFGELAAQCGPAELQEIAQRLADLKQEEADIPEWDGDTLDDLRKAQQLFEAILAARG